MAEDTAPDRTPASGIKDAELPLAAASRRLRRSRKRPQVATGSLRRIRWNLKEAIAMRLRGATYEQLGKRFGVATSTVHEQLRGVFALLDPDRLAAYEDNRVRILSAVEASILDLLADPERQAKASLNNAAFTLTQVHQLRRLEAGQSTANLALHELVERVERDSARRRGVASPLAPDAT